MGSRKLPKDRFSKCWSVKSGKFPFYTVAGAVGAERGIAGSSRISQGVAAAAGRLINQVVECDPIGIEVVLGFRTSTDLDLGQKIPRFCDYRNSMAEIALQTDGFSLVG